MTPSKCAVVPRFAEPETCQKMFWGTAPPARVMLVALLTLRFWAIWKIQTPVALPESVTFVGMRRPVPHA
jgi:hypothetical protein